MGRKRHRRALDTQDIVARAEQRRRLSLLSLCPDAMPAAQRDADLIVAVEAPQLAERRTATETVRKLTRVERMLRAGVLEPHEADACEWYAGVAALAWDTTGVTAQLGGTGGGSRAHAPDPAMAKRQDIQDARDDYREATAFMAPQWRDLFEAVVCRNESLGPVAAAAFPTLGKSQANHRADKVLKLYANMLHQRFASRMGWRDAPVTAAEKPVATAKPAPKPEPILVSAELSAAIEKRGSLSGELWMSNPFADTIRRELGIAADDDLVSYQGMPVVMREGWRWGYVLVDTPAVAMAA